MPSVRNETIVADHLDVGVQWSHDADTPISSRPDGARTRFVFCAPGTGPSRIVRRVPNRVPCRSPNAVTRPIEVT